MNQQTKPIVYRCGHTSDGRIRNDNHYRSPSICIACNKDDQDGKPRTGQHQTP